MQGLKSDDLFPNFHQFLTTVMRFHWKGQNTTEKRSVDRLRLIMAHAMQLRAHYTPKAEKCYNLDYFGPKTQKWGLMYFQQEYA